VLKLRESSSPPLFLTQRSPTPCKKQPFSNLRIPLRERSLLMNRELKMIKKKSSRPSRLRKKKGKMRMKKLLFNR